MDWREYIENSYNTRVAGENVRLFPPASDQALSSLEDTLGMSLPGSLKSLLSATNGVMQTMRLEGKEIPIGWLVWPVEEIEKQNSWFRSMQQDLPYQQSFEDLLLFADAGADGILFAVPCPRCPDKRGASLGICAWIPIADTLNEVAPSLEVFLDPKHAVTV